MTKASIEQEIQRITNQIVEEFDPEKIVLYGSWAWGEPREDSDIDLFVIKESTQKPLDLMREVDRILDDRVVAVETLVYTPEQCARRLQMGDPFVKRILMQGKVLYERKA